MKTRIAILTLLAVFTAGAATLTIDIPTNDVPRVSEAFGALYGLGHNASMPEVAYLTRVNWLMERTYAWERAKSANQYVQPPLELQPTPTPTPTATATPTGTPSATPSPTAGLRSASTPKPKK